MVLKLVEKFIQLARFFSEKESTSEQNKNGEEDKKNKEDDKKNENEENKQEEEDYDDWEDEEDYEDEEPRRITPFRVIWYSFLGVFSYNYYLNLYERKPEESWGKIIFNYRIFQNYVRFHKLDSFLC